MGADRVIGSSVHRPIGSFWIFDFGFSIETVRNR
jgi:hypothetical protein